MESLNYHHLLYFWLVAREGGLVQAGKLLRLSHPTLSAQIHALEDRVGVKLFVREGRRLALTDAGRVAFRYAEEIFGLGRELLGALQGQGTGGPVRLDVGVTDSVPKLVARRLLGPALALPGQVRLVCAEGSHERLLAGLAEHSLDLVLSDAPVPPGSRVKAFTHLLGECGVSLLGAPALVAARKRGFPASLDGAPLLLPTESLPLRRALDQWFAGLGVRPKVVAEFADPALLKVFGADGLGLFPAPTAVEAEVVAQYGVKVLGRTEAVRERFYALSVERRLKNPAVLAICDAARLDLFAPRARR